MEHCAKCFTYMISCNTQINPSGRCNISCILQETWNDLMQGNGRTKNWNPVSAHHIALPCSEHFIKIKGTHTLKSFTTYLVQLMSPADFSSVKWGHCRQWPQRSFFALSGTQQLTMLNDQNRTDGKARSDSSQQNAQVHSSSGQKNLYWTHLALGLSFIWTTFPEMDMEGRGAGII